ncbi:MAG: DoxX family protein [Candidatus Marinimicrobia bacterium]|nr:DoxX family protein [Candidatus Neomarinimicrobiota bacterium]
MDSLNKFSPYTHWLVRLSLAATFIYHGLGKFPMAQGMADMMGMPIFMVYMLALMEVAGGLLILWGGVGPDWATRAAGGIFAVVMLGAIMMVHWPNGWNFMSGFGEGTNNAGGMEFQVLLFVTGLTYFINGNSDNK